MSKLSIVIPTRERADTLFYTIKTLIEQDYQSCEIIVSDNASEDNTSEIVHSFSDPRIRYVNTEKRISMADNWEFALKHVRGEFVTYIGDDDGFLPGAITKAMRLLDETKMSALIWDKVEYCWPDYVDENMRNWFSLRSGRSCLQVVNSRKRLEKVIRFREGYTRLPCLYNGIIKKSLLDRVSTLSTNGLFFNAISPDVFSGLALSMVVDRYLLTDYPFSVNGASRHSNGTAFVRSKNLNIAGSDPTQKFMSENSREYDDRIKMAPSTTICVMGELLLAKKFLPGLPFPEPRWSDYIRALIRNAKYSLVAESILQSATHTANLLRLRTSIPAHVDAQARKIVVDIGFNRGSFNFKVPVSMVGNVYDACQLVGSMLPPEIGDISKSPLDEFIKKLRECLVSEAIKLYRSI